jgi:hypothetical protein
MLARKQMQLAHASTAEHPLEDNVSPIVLHMVTAAIHVTCSVLNRQADMV